MVILIRGTGRPTRWAPVETYGRKHGTPIDLALRPPSKSRLRQKTKVWSSHTEPTHKCHQLHVRLEQDTVFGYRACYGKKCHRPRSYRILGSFPLFTRNVIYRYHRLPGHENFQASLGYRSGSLLLSCPRTRPKIHICCQKGSLR